MGAYANDTIKNIYTVTYLRFLNTEHLVKEIVAGVRRPYTIVNSYHKSTIEQNQPYILIGYVFADLSRIRTIHSLAILVHHHDQDFQLDL